MFTYLTLETLPAGTKPRASHHRSPGGERRGKRKRVDHGDHMWNQNGLHALITEITRETKTVYMRWYWWSYVKQKLFTCANHGDHTWSKNGLYVLMKVITTWNKNGLYALMTVIIRETKTVYMRWWRWSYVKQKLSTCVDDGNHT